MSDRKSAQLVDPFIVLSKLIKSGAGRCITVSVHTAGTQGTLHDVESVGEASGLNIMASITPLVGTYLIDMPFYKGLVYVPAGGQAVSIGYI